jgi:hypothetical protein
MAWLEIVEREAETAEARPFLYVGSKLASSNDRRGVCFCQT